MFKIYTCMLHQGKDNIIQKQDQQKVYKQYFRHLNV